MTRHGDNKRTTKRSKKKLASGAAPPQRSLADWIQYAEAEQPDDVCLKDGVVHVYSELARRTMPALKTPTEPAPVKPLVTSESIRDQLQLLWADVKFWKLVSSSESDAVVLDWFIRESHSLMLPGFPPEVWNQLVRTPVQREKLFEVFQGQEWRWLPVQVTLDSERVMGELKSKWFNKLLDEYITAPRIALTRALASHEFSEQALKAIKSMASRLASDADWCLKNRKVSDVPIRRVRGNRDGVVVVKAHEQLIPADALHQGRGRPFDREVAKRVEQLAELWKRNTHLSDAAVATALRKEMASDAALKSVDDDALRKSAAVASELLWYREGIRVPASGRQSRWK